METENELKDFENESESCRSSVRELLDYIFKAPPWKFVKMPEDSPYVSEGKTHWWVRT